MKSQSPLLSYVISERLLKHPHKQFWKIHKNPPEANKINPYTHKNCNKHKKCITIFECSSIFTFKIIFAIYCHCIKYQSIFTMLKLELDRARALMLPSRFLLMDYGSVSQTMNLIFISIFRTMNLI